ncbi:myeloid differentiation primary response protein MyD88-like [Palaemon carinicauda]|uniref:myeloid differentiation primary response protein MyD88-like n=1 Tax=Palaemon carinicauda TaxID=392227 RepID=UPI0035B58E58
MSGLRNEVLEASVRILGTATRQMLSSRLDPRKVLLSPLGFRRDWRGLAMQAGIDEGSISSGKISDTECFFQKWRAKDGTVGKLLDFLEAMDRFDVIDDTLEMIYGDYDKSKDEVGGLRTLSPPPMDHVSLYDQNILTVDDLKNLEAGRGLQHYDALVLYADAEKDIDFVQTLVEKLEGEYGLKLCLKDRDLVAGLQFETEAVVRVITERCSRVIVVLSTEFLASNVNRYFTGFAHALSVDQRSRIIIPCQLERCERPAIINFCHSLDYYRAQGLWNYWEKLRDSLVVPPVQQSLPSVLPRATIQELPSAPTVPSSPESVNSHSPSSSRNFFSKILRKGDSYGKLKMGSPSDSTFYQVNKVTAEGDGTKPDHEVTHSTNGHACSSAIPIRKSSASAMSISLSSASGESNDLTHVLGSLPDVPETPPVSPMSTTCSKVLLLPEVSTPTPKSPSKFLERIFKGKQKRKDYG